MQEHNLDKNKSEKNKRQDHLSEAVLLSYIEGELAGSELQAAQAHLNACSDCMSLVAAAHREQLALDDKARIDEIVRGVELNVEGQLQRLIDAGMVESDNGRSSQIQNNPSFLLLFLIRLRAISKHARFYYATAGSLAVAALLIFFIGIPQYMAWQSDGLVDKSLAAMIANYSVTDRTAPRPTGGFQYPFFGGTRDRGSAREEPDTIATALQNAVELNERNARALQYFGTYFLVEKNDFEKAREAYEKAFTLDSTDASILTDLGVLAWYEERFDVAIEKFELALHYDSAFAEAQYNLAILLQKLGQKQTAIRAWEKYLQIDSVSTWAKIAKEHLDKLRTE